MSKREKTEIIVAKILSRLAENGTSKCTVDVPYIDPENTLEIDKKAFLDALDWLESEGLIRCGRGWLGLVGRDDCVLTSYGFAVLGQPFGKGKEPATVEEEAARIDRSNGLDGGKVGDFLGGLIGGFTKSISS